MKKLVIIFIALAMLAPFSSCKRGKVFREYHKFENNQWKRIDEDIHFSVDIEDINEAYDISIPIRHASFYPHQYLEIGFNIYSPSGQESYAVKKIYLKDRNGKWKGDGMGDIWDFDFNIYREYQFNEAGKWTFEIQNLTGNTFYLPGIMEIGLDISRTKK